MCDDYSKGKAFSIMMGFGKLQHFGIISDLKYHPWIDIKKSELKNELHNTKEIQHKLT